jgi:hypothetical protein
MASSYAALPKLTAKQMDQLGQRIFYNECRQQISCLTSWNKGEEFPSLGIGHFIWYPQGYRGPYQQTFPQLIQFMHKQGANVPVWLQQAIKSGAPWPSRQAFNQALQQPRLIELRQLLARTQGLQAQFIAQRFDRQLPQLLAAVSKNERPLLQQKINQLAQSPQGLYALIDYLNFKGSGLSAKERYQQQGWGLLQVLLAMPLAATSTAAVKDFVVAAKNILAQRVKNSPPERDEQRWLKGWQRRLDSYSEGLP